MTRSTGAPTAVTMWDFSWLLRRSGAEAEYADVDRVLDELAERGYDTVRIDAFPHWIAADPDGVSTEAVTALPQGPTFMWGNHAATDVEPASALLDFLAGLRSRGLRVALSTWLTPDVTGRSDRVRSPDDLARVWVETLELIDREGFLDLIDYVDLCNEWPLFTPGPRRGIWPQAEPDERRPQSWTTDEVGRIDAYGASVRAVKAQFPAVPLLFSYCLRGAELPTADDCMRLSTEPYDLAEVHLWLSSTPAFVDATAFTNAADTWDRLATHQRLVEDIYWADRETWLGDLDELMARWKTWADERSLPMWTTECWGSVFWKPELTDSTDPWAYIRDAAEHAVPRAVAQGWAGIATSNFSQPHHPQLWADLNWHRRMTDIIHTG